MLIYVLSNSKPNIQLFLLFNSRFAIHNTITTAHISIEVFNLRFSLCFQVTVAGVKKLTTRYKNRKEYSKKYDKTNEKNNILFIKWEPEFRLLFEWPTKRWRYELTFQIKYRQTGNFFWMQFVAYIEKLKYDLHFFHIRQLVLVNGKKTGFRYFTIAFHAKRVKSMAFVNNTKVKRILRVYQLHKDIYVFLCISLYYSMLFFLFSYICVHTARCIYNETVSYRNTSK